MGINLDVGAHPGPMGNLSPHGMVAGHCLAPCDFGSFGLSAGRHVAWLLATVLFLVALCLT